MLNIKELLESDSVSTIVEKINYNFASLQNIMGPLGPRGSQGLPGVPGRTGPTGPIGPMGPTGTIVDIIPFSEPYGPNFGSVTGGIPIGPTSGSYTYLNYGTIGPWDKDSWQWIQSHPVYGSTGIANNSILIDHKNSGYWKYLTGPNSEDNIYGSDITPSSSISYPNVTSDNGSIGWNGPGWYFYPIENSSSGLVWENDNTNYFKISSGTSTVFGNFFGLTGTTGRGYEGLQVNNARLVSRLGSVFISSAGGLLPTEKDTKTIRDIYDLPQRTPGTKNLGIDRLLFKMSLDGIPYLYNASARITTESTSIENKNSDITSMVAQLPRPSYGISVFEFSPLLFLSEKRNFESSGQESHGTLGIYCWSESELNDGDNNLKNIFLFSSRGSSKNESNITSPTDPVLSQTDTVNKSEFIFDAKRLVTTNQFVCLPAKDWKLSYETDLGGPESIFVAQSSRVAQGFIAPINGNYVGSDNYSIKLDQWLFSDEVPRRNIWFGSAIYETKPSEFISNSNDNIPLVQLAGFKERGRTLSTNSLKISELIFYTSAFSTSVSNYEYDSVNPAKNQHRSLPSLYLSPLQNVGIGTFAGGDTIVDSLEFQTPIEPYGKFHVHLKQFESSLFSSSSVNENFKILTPITIGETPFTIGETTGSTIFYLNKNNKPIGINSSFTTENTDSSAQISDILLGFLDTPEAITEFNISDFNRFPKTLKAAIRTEKNSDDSVSLRLGIKNGTSAENIGQTNIFQTSKEFQISIVSLRNSETSNTDLTGVGIHNLFPTSRFQIFGKNLFDETKENLEPFGIRQIKDAGITVSSPGPFYYSANVYHKPSANKISFDYISSAGTQPQAGLLDYPYEIFKDGPTTIYSPNTVNFPKREMTEGPTTRLVPWNSGTVPSDWFSKYNSFFGGHTKSSFSLKSFVGFNLQKDLQDGDQLNGTWTIGTSETRENGAAGLMFSSSGKLGFLNIPKGRDGGKIYQGWEQRRLSTRDILNNIKIVFDEHGNIGMSNSAGWDLNAYPSLERNPKSGKLWYIRLGNPLDVGPVAPPAESDQSSIITDYNFENWSLDSIDSRRFGRLTNAYLTSSIKIEDINAQATLGEYIRLEIAAEKAWSRDSRSLFRCGYGYPRNLGNIDIGDYFTILNSNIDNYIPNYDISNYISSNLNISNPEFQIITDNEGRIVSSRLKYSGHIQSLLETALSSSTIITYPHPLEFNGNENVVGAVAAEWSGMSDIHEDKTYFIQQIVDNSEVPSINYTYLWLIPTFDLRGSANIRLNNFTFGEGTSYQNHSTETSVVENTTAFLDTNGAIDWSTINQPNFLNSLSKYFIQKKRKESPKIILTMLEETKSQHVGDDFVDEYKKVNTVISTAQNEVGLREYTIPKADNTGGTFMVFTDHFGVKGDLFQELDNTKFEIESVITVEHTWSSGLSLSNDYEYNYNNFSLESIDNRFVQISNIQYKKFPSAFQDKNIKFIQQPFNNIWTYGGKRNLITKYEDAVPQQYNQYEIDTAHSNFRFKRINSEFVLVDFNITVKIGNTNYHSLYGASSNLFNSNYIDFLHPRLTQKIEIFYNLDGDDENYQNRTENIWGNALYLNSWSSWNKWNLGSANTSDLVGNYNFDDTKNLFVGNLPLITGHRPYTYTSNFYTNFYTDDFIYKNINSLSSSIVPYPQGYENLVANLTNVESESFLLSMFNPSYIDYLSSTDNPWSWYNSITPTPPKAPYNSLLNIYGPDVMSQNRSMHWRILPYTTKPQSATLNTHETFKIEIVLDKPILHTYHRMNAQIFGSEQPFSHLTLSGQSIVKYEKTSF